MTDHTDNDVGLGRRGNGDFVAVFVRLMVLAFTDAVHVEFMQTVYFVAVFGLLAQNPLVKQKVFLMAFKQGVARQKILRNSRIRAWAMVRSRFNLKRALALAKQGPVGSLGVAIDCREGILPAPNSGSGTSVVRASALFRIIVLTISSMINGVPSYDCIALSSPDCQPRTSKIILSVGRRVYQHTLRSADQCGWQNSAWSAGSKTQ